MTAASVMPMKSSRFKAKQSSLCLISWALWCRGLPCRSQPLWVSVLWLNINPRSRNLVV